MKRSLLSLTPLVFLALTGCASAVSRFELADTYYLQGNYAMALRYYREARQKDPTLVGIDEKMRVTEIRLYIQRGDQAVQRRQWAAAERAYREVDRLDPRNEEVADRRRWMVSERANVHFERGQELLAKGNPFDAVSAFEQALTFQPDHARAAEALETARREKRDREARAETAFQEAQRAWASERYEEAIRHFVRALDLNPHHAGAGRELRYARARLTELLVREGDTFMERRQWTKALEAYRRAQRQNTGFAGMEERIAHAEREARAANLVAQGNEAFDRGDLQSAYERFHEAWTLSSEREYFRARYETVRDRLAERIYSQARTAERDGRFQDAVTAYESIAAFHPGYRDIVERSHQLQVSLHTAREAYEAGCRAQEARDLASALEQFRNCAHAIPHFRDVDERRASIREDITRAEDFYDRALQAELRGETERARVLFEECLSISTPFRDASDRLARARHAFATRASIRELYEVGCRAHDAKDLERAREHFLSCQRIQPGYLDLTVRLRDIEIALTRAGEIHDRAVQAEARYELERASLLYEECLTISTPFADAQIRLKRARGALRTLEEARKLERERRLVEAKKRYRQLLKQYNAFEEAEQRIRGIDSVCNDLTIDYEALVEAHRVRQFRLALSHARKIRKRCVGFRDVEARITTLSSEVDYADGCSFEEEGKYEEAARHFERCAQRSPEFKDVKERLRRVREEKHSDRGVRDHGRGQGRRRESRRYRG